MVKEKGGWKDLLVGHLIAFVFCVAFPGLVTAIAPVSWVSFQRHGNQVSAHTQICLLFVLPYSSKIIDPVVGVGDRFVQGKLERSASDSRSHRTENQGFLIIDGANQTVEVPVSPFNVKSVTQRVQDFLANSQATNLKMTVVANWKFSVFAGGLVSLLTVLYVVGMALSIFRGIPRLFQYLTRTHAEQGQGDY